jgi:hypothetical protein
MSRRELHIMGLCDWGEVVRDRARHKMLNNPHSSVHEDRHDKTTAVISGQGLLPVTDAQARAVEAVAGFGQTAVKEAGQLARYMGWIVGTVPEDIVGFVLGDPLHFVRTRIAQNYDARIRKILRDRNRNTTEPVGPSFAIPLIRAAYDENCKTYGQGYLRRPWTRADQVACGYHLLLRSSNLIHWTPLF